MNTTLMSRPLRRSFIAVMLAVVAAATLLPIGLARADAQSKTGAPLLVFAAASLKTALDDIVKSYGAAGKGDVIVSYAATSALAKQIAAGAPASIFISADQAWMDDVAAQDLIVPSSRIDLLGNALVLIAPTESKLAAADASTIPDIAALLGDGRLAVADTAAVPAGRYAKEALEKLGQWASVEQRLAPAQNVRMALAFVARSEAPLGIVYMSDARAEPKVKIIARFPADSHKPIVYPAAIVATASEQPAAKAFLAYLGTEPAAKIFEANGFRVLAHAAH